MTDNMRRSEVFTALERLVCETEFFVTVSRETDPDRLDLLEAFMGYRLAEDYREFLLRFGDANVGYVPIHGLGSRDASGLPGSQSLTAERREEWPSFPSGSLALGEDDTTIYLLRQDGVVEARTESSRDLDVFASWPSFSEFLASLIKRAVKQGSDFGFVPLGFSPW